MPQECLLVAAPNDEREASFAVPSIKALIEQSRIPVVILTERHLCWFWDSVVSAVTIEYNEHTPRKTRKDLANYFQEKYSKHLEISILLLNSEIHPRYLKTIGPKEVFGEFKAPYQKEITQPLKTPVLNKKHRSLYYEQLVEEMKITVEPESHYFKQPRRLPQDNAYKGKPLILLHPSSSYGSASQLPSHTFETVYAAQHTSHDFAVLQEGKKDQVATKLAKKLKLPVYNYRSDSGWKVLLHEIFPKTGGLITSDTPFSHLLASAGIPTVQTMGAFTPEHFRLLGSKHQTLHDPQACTGCQLSKCLFKHHPCMTEISSKAIETALLASLSKG